MFLRQTYPKIMVKKYVYSKRKKPNKPKTQNQPEEKIIKNRNLCKFKKENKVIKDRIIRDIRVLFDWEDD